MTTITTDVADLSAYGETLFLSVDATRFRLNRLLLGEAVARERAGARLPQIEKYHAAMAREARAASKAERRADRSVSVHKRILRAAQRTEAAAHPCLNFTDTRG